MTLPKSQEMTKASKEEYAAFLAKYPRPLVVDTCGISEPPLVTQNDFTLGKWPASVVASHHAGKDNYKIARGLV